MTSEAPLLTAAQPVEVPLLRAAQAIAVPLLRAARAGARVRPQELDLPRRESVLSSLLRSFELLSRRGPGVYGWATPFQDDAIAFLLDSTSDAINLWASSGQLLHQNRAALGSNVGSADEVSLARFAVRGRLFERRCLRCYKGPEDQYLLEIIREVVDPDP
jgi:hypothetical protein